jgi:hypothetical protein
MHDAKEAYDALGPQSSLTENALATTVLQLQGLKYGTMIVVPEGRAVEAAADAELTQAARAEADAALAAGKLLERRMRREPSTAKSTRPSADIQSPWDLLSRKRSMPSPKRNDPTFMVSAVKSVRLRRPRMPGRRCGTPNQQPFRLGPQRNLRTEQPSLLVGRAAFSTGF